MNTPTITMPQHEARERLRAYRKQIHRRADAEYEAVARGYEALAAGTALISLRQVFQEACPFDAKRRPRLAIARADRRQVHFRWNGGTTGRFDTNVRGPWGGRRWWPSLAIDVDFGMNLPPDPKKNGFALVPMIPAELREHHPASYDRDRFILFEVDEWADQRIGAPAPVDPYLLEHLGGDLYAVLAEWELTELERAVVAGRRDS